MPSTTMAECSVRCISSGILVFACCVDSHAMAVAYHYPKACIMHVSRFAVSLEFNFINSPPEELKVWYVDLCGL